MSDQIITTEQNAHIDFDTELETPRLVALLFAEWVSKSADGKPVLAGVFDRIFFRPGTPTVFFVYLKLGQAHKEKSDIFIYGPTGERLAEIGVEPPELGSVPDRNPVYMQVITQVALPFEQEGVYWFEVVYQERRLALATLHVERLKDNNDVTSNT